MMENISIVQYSPIEVMVRAMEGEKITTTGTITISSSIRYAGNLAWSFFNTGKKKPDFLDRASLFRRSGTP